MKNEEAGEFLEAMGVLLIIGLIFGAGFFVARKTEPSNTPPALVYPITIVSPHPPDSVLEGFTVDGVELHCWLWDTKTENE